MTYKAAVAGLNLGGGKSVIIGDNRTTRREEIFRAHGRFVETLGAATSPPRTSGTSVDDMEFVAMETEHVTGRAATSGDPSPVTAYGVYRGIKAAAMAKFGSDSLSGKTVTVQGVGHVGYYLCQNLASEGARSWSSPTSTRSGCSGWCTTSAPRRSATDEIYGVEADIYAPSALGATVNDDTIPVLKAKIVAGAANNVLAEERHGDMLHERGILYAPDYVINAGGLINVYGELNGWTAERRCARRARSTPRCCASSSSPRGGPPHLPGRRPHRRAAHRGRGPIQQTWV
jgi:leucine dehydrogenase